MSNFVIVKLEYSKQQFKQLIKAAMSSSRSVLSNQSSHSNILTLSRDSSSSQIKSKSANIKLGFLFRIDTQDLDALYNKIVQCVNESDGFTSSDDADIAQLIQLARKLQDNHNLLKNMVEVLDQRFLKKINTPKKQNQSSQKSNFSLSMTPQSKFNSNDKNQQGTSISNKYNIQFQNNDQPLQKANKITPQNDYSGYFADTLQKARQSVQRKKQIMRMEKEREKQKQEQIFGENNFKSSDNNYNFQKKQQNATGGTEPNGLLKKSVYEGRVNKIFQQMNKIKQQLQKIENSENLNEQNQVLDPQVSLTFDTPFFQTQKTTQSQLMEKNKFEEDAEHQVFKQIQEDTYYLYDDRFSKSQQISANVPKLSLKNLYTKMGIDPNEDPSTNNLKAMTMIKQSSRQSESVADIGTQQKSQQQNEQYNLIQYPAHYSNYSNKSLQQYAYGRQTQKQVVNEDLTKTKQANVSTEAGNLTLQFSGHPAEKQQQHLHHQYYELEHENEQNSPQSQKSHSVSNATIIDKLSTFSYVQSNIQNKNGAEKTNDKQPTNTSILDQGFYNNLEQQNNKKRQTLGSIDTTVNNSGKSGHFGSMVMEQDKVKLDPVSPLQFQKSKFYTEIVQRNDKSREKINEYLNKLDERNRVLKNYVNDIQRSLSKQKQRQTQIGLRKNQSRKSANQDNIKSLTNTIYTDNQIIVPKYVPVNKFTLNNQASNLSVTQLSYQSKKADFSTNFSFSEVNPIQKNNIQFSPKFNSYSEKQLDSPKNEVNQSIDEKGMKPIVPMLLNLVENEEKNITSNKTQIDNQNKSGAKQYNQNKTFLKNDHYLTHECSLYAGQHHHEHENSKSKMTDTRKGNDGRENQNMRIAQKRQQRHQLQLVSNQSLNSIQGRIQQHQSQREDYNSFDAGSNQFVIPRVSANSLFEQTRNVESKIELSEDRSYKMVVPGEQIERIKDRVNQMFKKMKPMRQEASHLTKLDIPESQSIQRIQDQKNITNYDSLNYKQKQWNQYVSENEKKIADPKPKFQFKVPQKSSMNITSQFRSTGTFFHPPQQKKIIQNAFRNTAPFSQSSHVKDSLVIESNNRETIHTRFSFMYDSANRSSRESVQNRISQPFPHNELQSKIMPHANAMNYSRQSNFSFKPFVNTFGQDSIRSSVTNSQFQHASRTESNASSQQKRVQPIKIPTGNLIVSKIMPINRAPSINSVRSSSNQSKSSFVKQSNLNQFVPLKHGPPLPPKPQPLNQSSIKSNNPQVAKHFANFPIKNQGKFMTPLSPVKLPFQIKTNLPQRRQIKYQTVRTPRVQNNIQNSMSFLPLESRGLSRNYSDAVLTQSVVSSYANLSASQKQFVHPHMVSVPIPVSSRSRRDIQNWSNANISTSIVLADNSRGADRSTSRSTKSRSKKGIKVVSRHEGEQ